MVRLKMDLRPRLVGLAFRFKLAGRFAPRIGLTPDLAFTPHFQIERFGERIDTRHADTVETPRNFIRGVVEFPARMEGCQHNLRGRFFFGRMHVCRDPAPIVDHGDRIIDVDLDVDVRTESRKGLIDRIIDDFVD